MVKMKKYPKIQNYYNERGKIVSEELTILEKIDGANGRFKCKDGKIYFGTRNTKQTSHDEPLDIEDMNNSFVHAYKYLQRSLDINKLERISIPNKKLTIFGECLHKHSIDYDSWKGRSPNPSKDKVPNFICFDIYVDGKGFLQFKKIENICRKIGLETVPVIDRCSYKEFKQKYTLEENKFEYPESKFREKKPNKDNNFDKEGLAEGVVIRNEKTREKVKMVHPEFRETNRNYSKSKKLSDEQQKANFFVNKYMTKNRILKIARKIRDEKEMEQLSMSIMSELPLRVIDDIFEEEETDIDREDEDIMSEIRSKASSKCSTALSSEIN